MEESLSMAQWLAIGAAFALGVFGFIGPRFHGKIWWNEIGMHPDKPFENWIFGLTTWRAFVRTGSVAAPALVSAPALVAADEFFGPLNPLTLLIALPTTALMVSIGSIFLFNRPKLLVAPQFRHQPGWIAEVFGARVEPTPPPSGLKQWRGRRLDGETR